MVYSEASGGTHGSNKEETSAATIVITIGAPATTVVSAVVSAVVITHCVM